MEFLVGMVLVGELVMAVLVGEAVMVLVTPAVFKPREGGLVMQD